MTGRRHLIGKEKLRTDTDSNRKKWVSARRDEEPLKRVGAATNRSSRIKDSMQQERKTSVDIKEETSANSHRKKTRSPTVNYETQQEAVATSQDWTKID